MASALNSEASLYSSLNKPGDRGSRFIQLADDIQKDQTLDLDCLNAEFRHKLGLLQEEEEELSDIFKAKLGLNPLDSDRLALLIEDKDKTTRQYVFNEFAKTNFSTQQCMRNAGAKWIEGQLTEPLIRKEDLAEKQASIYIFAAIKKFMEKDSTLNNEATGKEQIEKPFVPVMMKVFQILESFGSSGSKSPTPQSPASPSTGMPSPFEGAETKQGSVKGEKQTKNKLTIRKLIRTIGKAYSKKVGSINNSFKSKTDQNNNSTTVNGRNNDENYPSATKFWTYENVLESLKTDIDLVQFIIGHGIIRKELRDEILCQLCCQVSDNPSFESMRRGWVLHSLCISCFLPSTKLIGYYVSFLHQMSDTSPIIIDRILKNILRTNENGFRYHPSNSLELSSELEQKPLIFDVLLVDGRNVKVNVDSSCTSLEICNEICRQINLEDSFGFSLYISIYERVSSLGCGLDHVMDAITECEHLARDRGVANEQQSPWKLTFRKELFTPWFDPKIDPVSTDLIYRQIVQGFKNEDLKFPVGIIDTILAQIMFVEYGKLSVELIINKMPECAPKSLIQERRDFENLIQSVDQVANRLSLNTNDSTQIEVKNSIVTCASQFLSSNFSALFEAVNFGEFPQLPPQEVIIALNSCGVTILSPVAMMPLAFFKFSDLLIAYTNRSTDISSSVITMVAIDGVQYSLGSPNAEVAAKIIVAFLSGLRRRSRWAVAVKPFMFKDFRKNKDMKEFELIQGDTVELLDEIIEGTLHKNESGEVLHGVCERTGLKGYFPVDVVYVIPTTNRPAQEFLDTLQLIGKEVAESTKTYFLKSRVIMADADTIKRHPDSCA